MTSLLKNGAKDPTEALFGIDQESNGFFCSLSEGPHWLIAGTTGSGKSVYINSILISMMYHSHPDELWITWIDPKKVEATAYIGSPYCPIDPVTDMNDAYGLVKYMSYIMDERYSVFEELGVKKIDEYNEWVEENPELAASKNYERMPYWVLVIDEYADMTMQNRDVEPQVVRIAQKARAAGIHMIVATQRPSADVISSVLKANIPSRVCLMVANATNSMVVIDEPGGEKLNKHGDSLIKDPSGKLTRVQGPYISNGEIASIFGELKQKFGEPSKKVDYKTEAVELGLVEWEDSYTDDVPMKDRHVKKVSGSGFRSGR